MELSTFFRVLVRRWYLVILTMVIAGGLAYLAVGTVGPTYRAEGSVLLLPPATTIEDNLDNDTRGNPFLLLGGLTQFRDIVIRDLMSKSTADEFAVSQPGTTYEALPDPTGPLIVVVVEADTSDGAVVGLKRVMAEVPTTLVDLQTGRNLDPSAYIESMPITVDSRADIVHKAQIRTLVAVYSVVTVLLLLLIGLLDGLLMSRRERAARADSRVAESDEPETGLPSPIVQPPQDQNGSPAASAKPRPGAGAATTTGAGPDEGPRAVRPTAPTERSSASNPGPRRPAKRTPSSTKKRPRG